MRAQRAVPRFEEVDPVYGLLFDLVWLGQAVEGAHPGGEVVQRGQMSEIAPVAAEKNLARVDQAVDALPDGSQFAG